MPFFNYTLHVHDAGATSYQERRAFLRAWWSLYRDDSRWTPPDYARLRREFDPRRNDHLARLDADLLTIDAQHRTGVSRSRTDQQEIPLTSVFERTLVAAVAVSDPRRKGKTAHLALPHLSADKEAFDTLYYHLVESFTARGIHRVIAPVGLSPHLGSGLLIDSWDEWPPLHTPSNPPYLPELMDARFRPLQDGRIYRLATPAQLPVMSSGPATVNPFDPARLADDLLPLLIAATENGTAGFPPPDAAETAFLLRMLASRDLRGFLAEIDGTAAGFALVGPDDAGRFRATDGGRSWWRRGLYAAKARLPGNNRVASGRVFFAAVLPAWRRQGIGAQLWDHVLAWAGECGWASLTIGPLWRAASGMSAAETFVAKRAAEARQTYRLYERWF